MYVAFPCPFRPCSCGRTDNARRLHTLVADKVFSPWALTWQLWTRVSLSAYQSRTVILWKPYEMRTSVIYTYELTYELRTRNISFGHFFQTTFAKLHQFMYWNRTELGSWKYLCLAKKPIAVVKHFCHITRNIIIYCVLVDLVVTIFFRNGPYTFQSSNFTAWTSQRSIVDTYF